jgi:hypothetical protein
VIPFGSSDDWAFGTDSYPPLWFCVRVLLHDGLRVPPFHQHPDGDGRLRALGLDATMWREWVDSVLQQHRVMGDFASALKPNEPPPSDAERQRIMTAARVLVRPGAFCPGSEELRSELDDLFVPLYQVGEDWKTRTITSMSDLLGSGQQYRELWNALTPFHDRLPNFEVFLVEYPAPAVMLVPPMTGIIAPALDATGYGRQVVEAASVLAA